MLGLKFKFDVDSIVFLCDELYRVEVISHKWDLSFFRMPKKKYRVKLLCNQNEIECSESELIR